MNQPRHVKYGDRGYDVTAYKRALNAYRADPAAQAGEAWPVLGHFSAVRPSGYGMNMVHAAAAVKARHPYITERGIGADTCAVLAPYIDGWGWKLLRLARPTCPVDPLGGRGQVIGVPYQGTHDHPMPGDPMHNWQSCNAIDLARTAGSPVYAICNGVIGPRIGPFNSANPLTAGQRLTLIGGGGQEWYMAHLSRLTVHAGQGVKAGQVVGYSGVANSVAHLHLGQRVGDPGLTVGDPSPGYRDRRYP